MDAPTAPRPLPDGLVLRTARPEDLEQIGALLLDRGEEGDDVDHRLVVEDPEAGWGSCGVVVDGDRVVSTATLLDETVRIEDVTLPAGQVELVATDEEYEGRGLARALMAWAHELSAARGHVLQTMIGIPYLYRVFGYEYAVDIPPARELVDAPSADGAPVLRRATAADVAALAALQTEAQAPYDVAVPHSAPRQRWLLEQTTSAPWLLERDGRVVASARVRPDDDDALVAEAAATDGDAADALLRGLVALHPGAELAVVHRAFTVPGRVWEPRLGAPGEAAEQYYARIPDVAAVLDALRPVLGRRLAASGIDRAGEDVVVSTFGRHYRMAVADDGALGPVTVGGRMPWPADEGGCAVAPDAVPALLLGPLGIDGLKRRRPDVFPDPSSDVYEALFPPLTADVLSYYLPW